MSDANTPSERAPDAAAASARPLRLEQSWGRGARSEPGPVAPVLLRSARRRGPARAAAAMAGRHGPVRSASDRGVGRRPDRVVERPHALAARPTNSVRAVGGAVRGTLRGTD